VKDIKIKPVLNNDSKERERPKKGDRHLAAKKCSIITFKINTGYLKTKKGQNEREKEEKTPLQ